MGTVGRAGGRGGRDCVTCGHARGGRPQEDCSDASPGDRDTEDDENERKRGG